jgi:hypothetical protein
MISLRISASTYYVDIAGSNSNNGSSTYPFQTIQRGVNAANAGDTVIVRSGNYGNEQITISRSGASNNRIKIMAETIGNAILEGNPTCGNSCTGAGFSLNDVSYITLDGFELRHFATGISVNYGGNNIFKNIILKSNSGQGIMVKNSNNNIVEKCQFLDPIPPANIGLAIQDYGIAFYRSDNSKVLNSYFFGNHNQALSFKKDDHGGLVSENTFEGCLHTGIYLGQNDGDNLWCSNLIVENNVLRPAAYPYQFENAIVVRNVKGAIVRNNFIEGVNAPPGNAVLVVNNTNGEDTYIYNNIVINSTREAFRIDRASTTYIYNNTLINTDGIIGSGYISENNYIKNNYGYTTNPALFVGPFNFTNNWVTHPDPEFSPDFSHAFSFLLDSESPIIDTGSHINNVVNDFMGTLRPQGTNYDIGAFEYKGDSPSPVKNIQIQSP